MGHFIASVPTSLEHRDMDGEDGSAVDAAEAAASSDRPVAPSDLPEAVLDDAVVDWSVFGGGE